MELFLFMVLLLGIWFGTPRGIIENSDEKQERDKDTSLDLYRPSNGIQHFTSFSSGHDPLTGDWWKNRIDMTVEDD